MSRDRKAPEKLKRIVIKEELVALTGDYKKAIILNQFIYWSERVADFDRYIAEERIRSEQTGNHIGINSLNGWIYKKAEELSEETMLNLSISNILNHIKKLISKGWLEIRKNPEYKWDKVNQYRVNLVKISDDLIELGYSLQGYKIDLLFLNTPLSNNSYIERRVFKVRKRAPENKIRTSETELRTSEIEVRNFELERRTSGMKKRPFNTEDRTEQNRRAIPEITSENNVVVVTAPQQEKINMKDAPEEDGVTFKCNGSTSNSKKSIPTPWDEIKVKVHSVAGAEINDAFAKEIFHKYTLAELNDALKEMGRQLKKGMRFKEGVGAWLRYALENHIEADNLTKEQPDAEGTRRDRSNKGIMSQPKSKVSVQEQKKKDLIRSLYV